MAFPSSEQWPMRRGGGYYPARDCPLIPTRRYKFKVGAIIF